MNSSIGKPNRDFLRSERAARFVLRKTKLRPRIGVVLGSGLGAFADELSKAVRIPYRAIPHFPRPTAIGHAGYVFIGTLDDVPVCVMQGRVHLFEGYTASEAAFPIRAMARMGVETLILSNSAGAIRADLSPGEFVVLRDHINLQGTSPLIGRGTGGRDERFGKRFCDLTHLYSGTYRELAIEQGRRLGLRVSEGVYAAVLGPNYETPAEIRYLRLIGADVVGMSTVPEAIAAAQTGMRVLGISCITNMAAGMRDQPITPDEVLEIAARAKNDFASLLRAMIPRMHAEPAAR